MSDDMKWTVEPWQVSHGLHNNSLIYSANGTLPIAALTTDLEALDDANARRIVACVNALAAVERPEKLPELLELCVYQAQSHYIACDAANGGSCNCGSALLRAKLDACDIDLTKLREKP